jgi:putative NIF3 family GTP cyclohydrolase 1 type 2
VSSLRRRLILVAVASATCLLPAGTAGAETLAAVQATLTREMRHAGPSAGAVVRDLDSGRTIFALRADNQRVPASVEKLYVSTAAFMRDGAEARIPTRAVAGGLDAFLTGEPAERVAATAREEGIQFVAAGHHATETFGVRRLGDLLAREHQIVHRFIDIPNPI